MPDWKRIVGKKLGTLPLSNGRSEEVIEEQSEQLASVYEEGARGGHGRAGSDAARVWPNSKTGKSFAAKLSSPSKVRAFRYGSKTVFSLPAAGRSGSHRA